MRNVVVLMRSELVEVVPTFLYCIELIDVELMFLPMSMRYIDVSRLMGC